LKELPVVNFTGIGLNPITFEQMFERVDSWLMVPQRRAFHIACVNAYCISLSITNKRVQKIYNSADIVGADGKPFVWWIKTFNKIFTDRLTAPNVLIKLIERSKTTGYTFYLYGGAPDVLVEMEKNLQEQYPFVRIVGSYSPPFRELSDLEKAAILSEINTLKPDIISVGLGTPKQDYWIDENLEKLYGGIVVASGATFDYFGGRIQMAPVLIQESGFEWVYRLFSKDFKRLWKRYTWHNIHFLYNFLLQKIGLSSFPLNSKKRV
jgi:N-acetylglucosaminyldiphosphoundecaprenol N-acetyl-beta-D-mannosaminyltransferase